MGARVGASGGGDGEGVEAEEERQPFKGRSRSRAAADQGQRQIYELRFSLFRSQLGSMTVLGGGFFGAWGERHAPAAHPAGGFDAEAGSGIGAHEPAGEVAGEVGGIPEK